ncbi:MAG: hypothetical protein DRI61_04165 [Chloroflexi bacterium]|nr:MAG: hypothetical protein DRI61_04165 [Chloroflexota bacterium]
MRRNGNSWLDRPVSDFLKLDWEKALYLIMLIIAAFTRFWNLGVRAMSHDESLHALYSFYLYNGRGYQHTPMMHGPFLFHANALIYFLFGANDFTARVVPALFGIALVGLPYFMRRWLGRAGALLTSFMLLISPSFLYYSRYIRNDIYIAVWNILLIIALFRFLEERSNRWLYMGAAVLSLAIATKEVAYITGFIGLTFLVICIFWETLTSSQAQNWRLMGAVASIFLIICVLILSAIALLKGEQAPAFLVKLTPYLSLLTGLLVGAVAAGYVYPGDSSERPFTKAVRSVNSSALGISALIFGVIYVLLFTTFLTNPKGLITGIFGSVAYWLAQHGVQRGGQPWYYYLFLMPIYEFFPLLLGSAGVVYYLNKRGNQVHQEGASPIHRAFIAFSLYWLITSLVIYSWAGEKMPWLILHPVLPFIVMGGMFGGYLLERVEWGRLWREGGVVAGLLLIPLLISLIQFLTVRPFQGLSLHKLSMTMRWLASLLAIIVLGYILYRYVKRMGVKLFLQVAGLVFGLILVLSTVRFAWMASFINYDNVKEFLVYAHGTPDIKVALRQIDEISLHTVGDRQIKFAYDDDSTWPLEWYFRNYPNRVYYGANPTRESLDAPVVIVGPKNESKAKPFLGDRYFKYTYRLVWWPKEDYKNMTPSRLWNMLRDPETRKSLWDVFLYRKYKTPLTEWPYVHYFYLYIRKDVYRKVWDLGAAPPPPIEEIDPYAKGFRRLEAVAQIGACGTGPGQFTDPRNLAVDKDGNIYVADSGNHRIQKFDPQGNLLLQWGSEGSGPGQFKEPWGIAVDEEGNVYVADTWNHRIQKFDSEGNFLLMWGYFASTDGKLGQEGVFWGPRAIAIDAEGNLYVTDTGNKRVQKFSPKGKFLGQWGGFGTGDGQFDEPVGIAIDKDGNIYVADTWNRRIQKFDRDFNYLAQWPILGWESQSVLNKPYLAVDNQGRIYATDPEFYRVLVFDSSGKFLFTFGQYGTDAASFNLPIGIAADAEGNIYVADSANCRILKFKP